MHNTTCGPLLLSDVPLSLCVCLLNITMSCAKTAELIKMPWLLDCGRPGNAPPPKLLIPAGNAGLHVVGTIWREPQLIGRWQRRCGHSLSVLQQLVSTARCSSRRLAYVLLLFLTISLRPII